MDEAAKEATMLAKVRRMGCDVKLDHEPKGKPAANSDLNKRLDGCQRGAMCSNQG